jgi:hypothetical protein
MTQHLDPGDEASDADLARVDDLAAEIEEYAAQLKAGGA